MESTEKNESGKKNHGAFEARQRSRIKAYKVFRRLYQILAKCSVHIAHRNIVISKPRFTRTNRFVVVVSNIKLTSFVQNQDPANICTCFAEQQSTKAMNIPQLNVWKEQKRKHTQKPEPAIH